jgi:putative SOS response-associated peptidase YedK
MAFFTKFIIPNFNHPTMCYYTANKNGISKLEKRFHAKAKVAEFTAEEKNNGFQHPTLPVILNQNPQTIDFLSWGLIPFWANPEQAKTIASKTLNAKSETIFEVASFKDSILSKRCIILVDGFYEWQHIGKDKNEFFITLRDEQPFAMGGVWSSWINTNGETKQTFSIITTPANPLMEEIHNTKKRMPLILPKESEQKWLSQNLSKHEIIHLMQPFDSSLMKANQVSPKANQISLF